MPLKYTNPFYQPPDTPGQPCQSYCCQRGEEWITHHYILDLYNNGPSPQELEYTGCWKPLTTQVRLLAESMRQAGLVKWQDLSPDTRGRLESWSPVAQELWESDFLAHREGIVQACIWHYLDDNLFSFAPDLEERVLVKPSSPVWEYVRGLRRELNRLGICKSEHDGRIYPIQFSVWSRLTEHLVRGGLGLQRSVAPAHLVAHFKSYHRQFVVDGEHMFPDDPHAEDLDYIGVIDNDTDSYNYVIRRLLRSALRAQVFLHGMPGRYTLRFSPIGSYETSEFPFDEDWMRPANASEVPPTRRGEQPDEPLPPVQLVSQPMLVASGLDGLSFDREFSLVTHMEVITPWTFGGPEAKEFLRPGYEKGWELLPAEVRNARMWPRIREAAARYDGEGKEGDNMPKTPGTDDQTAESPTAANAGESTNQETD
ncbi:uncharacterized protein B0H64DRAFT_446828 [Chaetomium fimeti]|uniref:Uncharacterized protein n=1 Tax=Chaetomium fimeti TaxID=1854472 RepID=A0AAE0H7B1_9PEZI|nr:hypothetical protein B0H64DRAFT_446828 [Chaetomium fimeti]